MTANLSKTASAEFTAVLAQAAAAYRGLISDRPPEEVVVNALLQAEKTAKQQRLLYPFESLQGKWRLCFATGTKKLAHRKGIALGKGFYVPKFARAQISFNTTTDVASRGEIGNSAQLGSVLLKLTGPAQYLGKKNLLAFDFTRMQISLFGRVVYSGQFPGSKAKDDNFYNQSIAKLPFFAFFLITEDFIAARGRGGGLALWIRS